MHELVQNVIEKHREKNKEILEYMRSQGNAQVSYSTQDIENLIERGLLPKELADWFFKDYENKRKQWLEMEDFAKNNPDLSAEERLKHFFKEGPLSIEETIQFYEDTARSGELLMLLIKNRHLLSGEVPIPSLPIQPLFRDVNPEEEFGIANCISNSLYHLEDLLKNMELSKLHENFYDARGSIKNSKGEAISLSYCFPASTQEEAEKTLKDYKSVMISKGLKVWFAHWQMANKHGRVEYGCPMIEIMKLVADENRESFFSVKEKEEYWAITKMLGMSKLSRERKIKKRGTANEIMQWVEQPLVEILGGEKEMAAEDKYPTSIAVRVLMPKIDKKGFAPHIYSNRIQKLHPSDTYLAYKIQTRASQLGRGTRDLHVDWDFIIEAGNLQTTAFSNPRGAKAKARKKMDRLQQSDIIEKWDEELLGVCVTPKKPKRKEKGQADNMAT